MPGVKAVIDAAQMASYIDKLRMPLGWPTKDLPPDITPYVLTPTEVCFVGEPIVMVLGTSRYIAEDGAAAMADMHRPGRVGRDIFDIDPRLRLRRAAPVIEATLDRVLQDRGEDRRLQCQIDEARPRDLRLDDLGVLAEHKDLKKVASVRGGRYGRVYSHRSPRSLSWPLPQIGRASCRERV
jgi:hypothetical protein